MDKKRRGFAECAHSQTFLERLKGGQVWTDYSMIAKAHLWHTGQSSVKLQIIAQRLVWRADYQLHHLWQQRYSESKLQSNRWHSQDMGIPDIPYISTTISSDASPVFTAELSAICIFLSFSFPLFFSTLSLDNRYRAWGFCPSSFQKAKISSQ